MNARLAMLVISLVLAGCGSLRAPSARPSAVFQSAPRVELTAVEGRPSGVLLRLRADTLEAERIELYRVTGDEDAELLQDLRLEQSIRSAIVDGIEIVDSTVVPGSFIYQLFAISSDGEVVDRSTAVEVAWREQPPRPTDLVALAPFGDAVELRWGSPLELGAVVFRRDVLEGSGGFVRVAQLPPGTTVWVDRDLQPAGVWSYSVALAFTHPSGLVQYGKSSEEIYSSTPEPP